MEKQDIQIVFSPGGQSVKSHSGISLIEAAARAGLVVNTPCGGAGTCGKCRVRFPRNAPDPSRADLKKIGEEEIKAGWRLACQSHILSDAEIEIPVTSTFGGSHQIQEEGTVARNLEPDTDIRKVFLKMQMPSLLDDYPDLMRIENEIAIRNFFPGKTIKLCASPLVMESLGRKLRAYGFTGTATLRGNALIHFEEGNCPENAYAVAFDIGTTTLVGALLNLYSGKDLAVASAMNPQTVYGDDVLSRIGFASRDGASLGEIRERLLICLRAMIPQLCDEAGVSAEHIYQVVFSGNTTMEHILAGISPASLGGVPFASAFGRGLTWPAGSFGLGVHPEAEIYFFPVIGGFVGGDTVAGMLATELSSLEGPVLMLDIGTNGEIVLCHEGRLWAASTAAGPAFEGARISCGMRAAEGAIEKVFIEQDLEFDVIGNTPPKGLCGSGLIDLCAQLLKAGVLSEEGRLLTGDEHSCRLSPALHRRLRFNHEGFPEFLIYEEKEGDITFTQQDIRELQLGTGAIRAGILILLKQVGLRPQDLKQVLIAGGFGSFIRRDNAQRIGLIPHEVAHEKIRFVGNTAFSGAKWAAVSQRARRAAETLARQTKHVELSLDPDFALEFAMAMHFPEAHSR